MVAYASAGILLDGGSGGGWDSGASSYSSGWDNGAAGYSAGWDGGAAAGGWDGGAAGWDGGAQLEEEVQVVRVQEEAHHHQPAPVKIVKVNTIIQFLYYFDLNCDKQMRMKCNYDRVLHLALQSQINIWINNN